jgi:deoxyribose-phosphate aldolase
MKYIEYASYDYGITEIELIDQLNKSYKKGITNYSLLPYSINTIKNLEFYKEGSIIISTPVDFPYGLSDLKTRNVAVAQCIKAGANIIDLFVPTKIITNRKYDKFREDIKSNLEICLEKNVKLRYILEYRIFNHQILSKVCQILTGLGIDTVLPSSGMMIDDIYDNLIACNFFLEKTQIKVIANGNIYNEKQAKCANEANIYGIRLHHLHGLDMILQKNKQIN